MARQKTKKAYLLEMLGGHGNLDLADAAEKLYGDREELARLKVIRLLSAYRKKDKTFENIRVRSGIITYI
ncbi:MAG: hypothetical protein A4E52_00067 [Pelotomaculum sp. PtaB.Bin013]|uniref:Uncharacterized protein n=1 Tax=Pelotomaculum isophthalicicum JI TaxID=947010 RepID=A0A9X4H392_9FIRM|nr:hypothetical protein [Pelotomaculum isophthalicicum]MDF9409501.1 hypothetical protein [Pelotomaculum isophthalicicum JI]OPX92201.1 MAG: hypothetical protein A4E52_00067 [Pelotomaculum sp. PtaB.Bin013]